MQVLVNKMSRIMQQYGVFLIAGCVISPSFSEAKTKEDSTKTPISTASDRKPRATPRGKSAGKSASYESRKDEAINVSAGRYLLKDPNRRLMTPKDWKLVMPGSNPLYMLQYTEGASLSGTDPFGVDMTTAGLYLRGFHMNELGVTYEGIPLNDIGWGGLTGTNVLKIGIAQDLGGISVSTGSGSVSTFSASDNGGDLHYFVRNPKDKAGASIWQSYGSNQTIQTTISADTGQIGHHGPKMLVGFQRNYSQKYMAYGDQQALRGHFKAVQDVSWGDFTAYFSGSTAKVTEYNDQSFQINDQLGWRADYFAPNYAYAYNISLPENATKDCGNGFSCKELAGLVSYNSGHSSQDLVGSLAHDFRISKILSGRASFYMTHSDTHEVLTDSGTPSLTGAPFSEQVWHPQNQRLGGTLSLRAKLGHHTVSGGFWQEHTDSRALTSWYNEPRLGTGAPLSVFGNFSQYGPAFQTQANSRWSTWERQLYLQDDITLSPNLHAGVGFKTLETSTSGGGLEGDAPRGTLSTRNYFLPHLSASWQWHKGHDVFVDIANNESGYRVSPQGQIGYSASAWTAGDQAAFDAATRNIKPENNWNFIIGGHDNLGWVRLSWDAYYDLISNRLLSVADDDGGLNSLTNTVAAVPHSHIIGGDVAINLPITRRFMLRQTLGVSKFTYDNDLFADGEVFPIKGSAQPGYPPITLSTMLIYSHNGTEAGVGSTFYSRRPFSYQNDMYAYAYWMTNLYLQHTFKLGGKMPPVTARFDVYNLLNRKLMGTIGTNGFPFNRDKGYSFGTMQRQAPRQAMFTLGVSF
ncbi:hypothetical protein N5W20_01565 [Candidatus Kirkpatrickella diaphorinae]|uniref:TonB-dependent receptor n=1 Tax=Candidatus Kirkpatrickella diaphorinae TaxID=2984322 RepID=A0ABY6GJU1_9PROT|nr:hypothetical protein [Candidatus Kirkpatrickella diaphorinae]UYH51594.1 hypothetical protein N5W20_01565 [Candidatus Kirkpatrickella diaphorinae]